MADKAKSLGIIPRIYSDKFQEDAEQAGQKLITETQNGEILLVGGETTVHVTGNGVGGRNLEVVLSSLKFLGESTIIASFDSDGWDNCSAAGGIGDIQTAQAAKAQNLDMQQYLKDDNSLEFFEKTEDTIMTGRLPSNVSDLIIVYKYE
jgi:glycerate-2-kinase